MLKLVRMDQQRLLTVLLLHVCFGSRQRQIKNVVRAKGNTWSVMRNGKYLKNTNVEKISRLTSA